MLVQCVDKMQQCFGDGDIRVGAALHNMAGLYMSMDPPDLDRAEGVFRQALDVSLRASFCINSPESYKQRQLS